MDIENISKDWSVWIDEEKKVITVKQSPNAREIFFKSKEIGLETVTELVSKGYKIG